MDRVICQKNNHQGNEIINFCLEPNCKTKRLMCMRCYRDHPKHQTTPFTNDIEISKISNLSMNSNCPQKNSVLEAVQMRLNQILKIKDQILKAINAFQETIEEELTSVAAVIYQTFDQQTAIRQITLLIQQQRNGQSQKAAQRAHRIARNTLKLELPHLKQQGSKLPYILQCIGKQIVPIFQKESLIISDSLQKLSETAKQWSLFGKKDLLGTLQTYNKNYYPKEVKREIQEKQNIKLIKEKNIKLLAKEKQWNEITAAKDNLPSIKQLNLYSQNIQNIPVLSPLTGLTELSLHNNQIKQIQNLNDLTNLTFLDLRKNQISEIRNIEKLVNLTVLGLTYNQISEIKNLDKLTKLTGLGLGGNQIKEIKNLEKLINLTGLGLGGNQITEIKNLEKLINLTELYLSKNKIAKIQGLQTISNLNKLGLSSNMIVKIENLEAKTKLQKLWIYGNKFDKTRLKEDEKKLASKLENQKAKIYWISKNE